MRKNGVLSVVLFVVLVGLMAYLRLYLYPHRILTLTYGLPLLVCLWHRDRRLLWALAATFTAMSTYKAQVLLPAYNPDDAPARLEWAMQLVNTVVIAGVVHAVLGLTDALRSKNAELEQSNEELAAREEEISRQNEELQTQSEELAGQNEELQQQFEEIQAQSEELQHSNAELRQREGMLQALLESLSGREEREVLDRVCRFALELLGGNAIGAAVLERSGSELRVLACAGLPGPTRDVRYDGSFAAVVLERDAVAFVEDLGARRDLLTQEGFRSVLAAPLRFAGQPAGVVELYAPLPSQWTREQFRIVEWVASQCALIIDARRASAKLEELVASRTGQLQELVGELEHFSYTITHDMRAPLRAMRSFASILAEDGEESGEQRKDYLHRIVTAAARMDRLITDALNSLLSG